MALSVRAMKNNDNNDRSQQPAIDIIIDEIIQPHILPSSLVTAHIKITFGIYAKEA